MKLHKENGQVTVEVIPGEIPGTIEREDGIYFPVGGEYYRIEAFQVHKKYGLIPILDMPLGDALPDKKGKRSESK